MITLFAYYVETYVVNFAVFTQCKIIDYNRNAVPPVVFVRGGKSGYAVKPQTYEDIARLDAIPQTE